MIYYTPAAQRTLSLFRTPFEQQLDANNRWVKMAELAPWDEMAKVFFSSMSKEEKRKRKKEQNKRSEVEGKFGQAKSKYGLDDVQTRRMDTTFACIGLILLALNLIKLGKAFFISIFAYCYSLYKVLEGCLTEIRLTSSPSESLNQLKNHCLPSTALNLG